MSQSVSSIRVELGERSYFVRVGEGIRELLSHEVEALGEGDVLIVHDGPDRPWAAEAIGALREAGRRVVECVLPAGEEQKDIRTVERIWDAALDGEIDRRGIVIGIGGGVVGDMTAFAASTLLRGVRLAQLPTTLLSMVDSSVGGKTGVNRPQGKNLVGTFYQPSFVLCDVETLETLPREERLAGLAEVVKSAWIDSNDSVAMLERDAAALREGDPEATIRAIEMSVRLKARIVSEDEHEAGTRMLLNFGHTVGHAIEAALNYSGIRHGEGVALGMIAALRLSESLGGARSREEARLVSLLRELGLPINLDDYLNEKVSAHLISDKKRRGSAIRFILPGPPGALEIRSIDVEAIRAALFR